MSTCAEEETAGKAALSDEEDFESTVDVVADKAG